MAWPATNSLARAGRGDASAYLFLEDKDYVLYILLLVITTIAVISFENLFLFFFIGVELLYNAVFISTVQQSESAICVHISHPFPFRSPQSTESLPCAKQTFLISYLSYTQYQ